MPTPEQRTEIENAKEGGRRRVLRVRFPHLYGLQEEWILRTLLRTEIFQAYDAAGHPEREIPDSEKHAQILLEDGILAAAVLFAPDWFPEFRRAPAGIATALAGIVLRQSGIVAGSPEQDALLERSLRYANSLEGRAEALVLHYLPSVRKSDLDLASYEELFRYVFQAISLAEAVDGKLLEEYLTPQGQIQKADVPVPSVSNARDSLEQLLNRPPDIARVKDSLGLRENDKCVIDRNAPRTFIADPNTPVDWKKLAPLTRQDSK